MHRRYKDTRGFDDSEPVFTDVILAGIAGGGGLYVPAYLPSLSADEILDLGNLPYPHLAAYLFQLFGVDIEYDRVKVLMDSAYGDNFDTPSIAPVTEAAPGMYLLELWHGPTSAFKDMALQCMPLFFSEAVAGKKATGHLEEDYLILVATSGDTGKAALEGFAGRDHVKIAVFYPAEGVSDIQRKQMVTQEGDNVVAFGVEGDFDDCQNSVKAVFNDMDFNRHLQDRYQLRLSSANSINWGRLLPQIAYYMSAYIRMVGAGAVEAGLPIDICVPTGNFGNILAAWYAKRIGVPIDRLICASNENRVLTDFLETGLYDISEREVVKTPSPSMDILISSNLERLLFEVCRDPERIHTWVSQLDDTGRFQIDPDTRESISTDFMGGSVTNEECLTAIRRVYDSYGRLIDPHTAVAWAVAERLHDGRPMLVVSTAHWSKFGGDVYRALKGIPHSDPLPQDASGLTALQLSMEVEEMAQAEKIPAGLTGLDNRRERFQIVIDGSAEGAGGALLTWLEGGDHARS